MKERQALPRQGKTLFISMCMLFLATTVWAQQTQYIMPLGNSITLGKSNFTDPTQSAADPTTHGYRGFLYELVHDGVPGYTLNMTGPTSGPEGVLNYGVSPYKGWFQNGAVIDDFLPGGTNDVIAKLNSGEFTNLPNYILLHIGTNDIGNIGDFQSPTIVGDYNVAGTIMYNLKQLMDDLLTWQSAGGDTVEQVFLCKIIPRAPYNEFPGVNANIQDYNSKIERFYDQYLEATYPGRVTLVDMYSLFYSNPTYYTADTNPTTIDDHVHPSQAGYEAMASRFADHILDYLSEAVKDEFQYTVGGLNGNNDWTASATVLVHDVAGETPGGAIYSSGTDAAWNHAAIWKNSYGMNSVTIRLDPSMSNDINITQGVGILVGMDTTAVYAPNAADRPHGYLVFIHKTGYAMVYEWDGTRGAGNEIVQKLGEVETGFGPLYAGDVFSVIYNKETNNNRIYVSRNGGTNVPVPFNENNVQLLQTSRNYYSGIVFRGENEGTSLLVDYIELDNKRLDLIAPDAINLDVLTSATTNSTITLEWYAVSDDGGTNGDKPASSYDLRYSMDPISSDEDFAEASIVANVPPPSDPGDLETVTIKGLLSDVSYYFAVKAVDDNGNMSDLSNSVSESTTSELTNEDNFASLDDWAYDPDEYGILNGELVNKLDDAVDRWGGLAIYKRVSNPTIAKLVWGDQVTNPSGSADENGGIIMMASDTTIYASGYLIFIRTVYNKIYLFDTYWNYGTNKRELVYLDGTSFTLSHKPAAGDTIAVVVDDSELNFTKFDVYSNADGQGMRPSARISLYDTRPSDERHGNGDKHYSGIMLTRFAQTSGRNNAVQKFIVAGPQAAISGLTALSPTSGNEGPVAKVLPDSVRVLVKNENNQLVSGVPVFFQATKGGGHASTEYGLDGIIRLEAEWGNPVSPMVTFEDNNASNGEYIASIQYGGDVRGTATYQFYVDSAATYYFWGRVSNISYAIHQYAIGFELVGKDPAGQGINWEVLKNETITGDWQWDMVQANTSSQPHSYYLEPGEYTIILRTAHRDVRVDELIITRRSPANWQPTGIETPHAVRTQTNGEAAVTWTLGTVADKLTTAAINEGENILSAWTLGGEKLDFYGRALAGDAAKITKNADDLEGSAGDTLDLSVSVFDIYDNIKPGQLVYFTVIQGDGTFLPGQGQVTTGNNGIAISKLKLGADDSCKVKAYFNPDSASVTITARAIVGNVGSLSAAPTQLPARLYVNTNYADLLKVTVYDTSGNPVGAGLPVQFVAQDGLSTKVGGSQSITVWTNASGLAKTTLNTGPRAGMAKVIARTSGRQVTVMQDSVFYLGAHLTKPADHHDRQVLNLNQLTPDPIRVFVSDANWNGVRKHPVTFQITKPESGFTFEDGGTSFIDTTDSYGFAEAKVRAGSRHGSVNAFENVVVASASNGFDPVPSPQYFTFYVKSNAYKFSKHTPDTTGVIGEMVGPLIVRLLQANGQPVGKQWITFERMTGNGSFNPETKLAKKVVLADSNGYAATNYWLGTYAGVDSNMLRIYTVNYDNTIQTFYNLKAQSSVGDTMAALTPTHINGIVGSAQNVQVKITDAGGNPGKGEEVIFRIKSGRNASVGTNTADTVTVVTANNSGVASVIWNLGTEAGTDNNRLEVYSHNGIYELKGSPLYFTASTSPGAVSYSRSEISATGPVPVGSDSASQITVSLYDPYGNPVPNKQLQIVVIGGSNNFPPKQTVTTNSSGMALGFLYSTTAGQRTIKAVVEGDTLFSSAKVIFLAGTAAYMEMYSGNDQVGNINTVLSKPFVVRVTDPNGNPVEYGPVNFNVYGNVGQMVEDMPIVTDADGYAEAHFKLGSVQGRYAAVQVSSPGLQNQETFWVTGRQGDVFAMWYPEGYNSVKNGIAGELSDPLTVQVMDQDSLPVFGEQVTFTVNPDEGSNGSIVGEATQTTDEYGQTSIRFRMDTRAGFESWIYAENATGTGKVWFKAISKAGPAYRITAVGSTQITDKTIGETLTLTVKVTDAYNNPIGNVLVGFEKLSGDAEFVGSNQAYTGQDGLAKVNVKLGNVAGTVRIQAVSNQEGSPILYTIQMNTSEQFASQLIRYPVSTDTVRGTTSSYLVDSLHVMVTDDYGNPVPDQVVLFRILAPANGSFISGDGREFTDSRGVAAVAFYCGPQSGYVHYVEARWNTQTVIFPIKTYYNSHAPVLNKDYISSVYPPVDEGSDIWIDLRASDADGDQLTFQIGNIFPPAGAYIDVIDNDEATFKWRPAYDQGRDEPYSVILRVVDNRGKSDQKTVKIFVRDKNQLPQITAIQPEETELDVRAGETIVFQVFASDPDGDALIYTWWVNGALVASGSSVYHHKVDPSITTGNQTVDVFVSDGPFTVSRRWSLNITTAVEMELLTARFVVENSSVQVVWKTAKQTEDASYQILRAERKEGPYRVVSEEDIPYSPEGSYSFFDSDVRVGSTYYYKIVDADQYGNRSEHGPIVITVPVPDNFQLSQNYPNPFNPSTKIRYILPEQDEVELTIYNMMGQHVATLVNKNQAAGFYTVEWDGKDEHGMEVGTGIYLYRLKTSHFSDTRRMVKLR